jgi:hypothetical protein
MVAAVPGPSRSPLDEGSDLLRGERRAHPDLVEQLVLSNRDPRFGSIAPRPAGEKEKRVTRTLTTRSAGKRPRSSADVDHHVADLLPGLEVPVSLDDLLQCPVRN